MARKILIKKLFHILIFIFLFSLILNPIFAFSVNSRPFWLLNNSDFKQDEWSFEIDADIDNRWIFGINPPRGGYFSIETLPFTSSESASSQVKNDLALDTKVNEAGDLHYVFPNFRFNFDVVDEGYAWEIKSPCCYSRGVIFSIENSYVYVFGSQQTKWQDLVYLYDRQVVKIQELNNKEVPLELQEEISQYEVSLLQEFSNGIQFDSSKISGILFILILPGIATIITLYPKIKSTFK